MPRAGLSRESVVDAASQLADAEGLEAVTLGRIAAELKVKTPSLYNHIESLAALHREIALRGMMEANARISKAAVGRARSEALLAVGRAYRAFAREHPGLYAASLRAPSPDDQELAAAGKEIVGTVLAVLSGYGLDGEDALHATRGLRAIIHGFVSLEAAGAFGLQLDTGESLDRLLMAFDRGLERLKTAATAAQGGM